MSGSRTVRTIHRDGSSFGEVKRVGQIKQEPGIQLFSLTKPSQVEKARIATQCQSGNSGATLQQAPKPALHTDQKLLSATTDLSSGCGPFFFENRTKQKQTNNKLSLSQQVHVERALAGFSGFSVLTGGERRAGRISELAGQSV